MSISIFKRIKKVSNSLKNEQVREAFNDFISYCKQNQLNEINVRRELFARFDNVNVLSQKLIENSSIQKLLELERSKHNIDNLGIRNFINNVEDDFGESHGIQESVIELNRYLADNKECEVYTQFMSEFQELGRSSDYYSRKLNNISENFNRLENYIKLDEVARVAYFNKDQNLYEVATKILEKNFDERKLQNSIVVNLKEFKQNKTANKLVEKVSYELIPENFNELTDFILKTVKSPQVIERVQHAIQMQKVLEKNEDKIRILIENIKNCDHRSSIVDLVLNKFANYQLSESQKEVNRKQAEKLNNDIEKCERNTSDYRIKEKLQEFKNVLNYGLNEAELRKLLERELADLEINSDRKDEYIRSFLESEKRKNDVRDLGVKQVLNDLQQTDAYATNIQLQYFVDQVYEQKNNEPRDYMLIENVMNGLANWQYDNAVSNSISTLKRNLTNLRPYVAIAQTKDILENSQYPEQYSKIIDILERAFSLPEYQATSYVTTELNKFRGLYEFVDTLLDNLQKIATNNSFKASKAQDKVNYSTKLRQYDFTSESETNSVSVKNVYALFEYGDSRHQYFFNSGDYFLIKNGNQIFRINENTAPNSLTEKVSSLKEFYYKNDTLIFEGSQNRVEIQNNKSEYPPVTSIDNLLEKDKRDILSGYGNEKETGIYECPSITHEQSENLADTIQGIFEEIYNVDYDREDGCIYFKKNINEMYPFEYKTVNINNKVFEASNKESMLNRISYLGLVMGRDNITQVIENGLDIIDNMVWLDFAKTFESKLYEGMVTNVYKIANQVYIHHIDPITYENKFEKTNANNALQLIQENHDVDASYLFHDILNERESAVKQYEIEREKIMKKINKVNENLDKIAKSSSSVQESSQVKVMRSKLEKQLQELKDKYQQVDEAIQKTGATKRFHPGDNVRLKDEQEDAYVSGYHSGANRYFTVSDTGDANASYPSELTDTQDQVDNIKSTYAQRMNLAGLSDAVRKSDRKQQTHDSLEQGSMVGSDDKKNESSFESLSKMYGSDMAAMLMSSREKYVKDKANSTKEYNNVQMVENMEQLNNSGIEIKKLKYKNKASANLKEMSYSEFVKSCPVIIEALVDNERVEFVPYPTNNEDVWFMFSGEVNESIKTNKKVNISGKLVYNILQSNI
jgi:hypothetical protein